MRRSIKTLAVTSAVIGGLVAAPALYASKGAGGSMMGPGMLGQMSEMMEGCNKMMQSMNRDGTGRPNDRWREDAPATRNATGTSG